MKWISREHVKVDRMACPWLIKKFVDEVSLCLDGAFCAAAQRAHAVRHRVQRVSDPLKPATLIVGACAGRINSGSRDHLAKVGNEAVRALDLLTDFCVGHLDIGHRASSSNGGSPFSSAFC